MNAKKEFQQRLQKIDELMREIESSADPKVRASAAELMQTLMEMHGTAVEKMLDIVFGSGPQGGVIIDDLAADPTVESLLLLYGLHPLDQDTRVMQALEKASAALKAHGAEVELLGMQDGAVSLRLSGINSGGCGSSAATLRAMIEEAIYENAPDITSLQIEEPAQPVVLVQLERVAKKAAPTVQNTAIGV